MKARLERVAHFAFGAQQEVEEASQVFLAEKLGQLRQPRPLFARHLHQRAFRAATLGHHQVAHGAGEFGAEMREFITFRRELPQQLENPPRVPRVDGLQHVTQQLGGNHAQHLANARFLELVSAGGDDLVEQRKAIAHASFGSLGDGAEGAFVRLDVFLLADPFQAREDLLVVEQPEGEVLAARLDGGGEFVRLGGGQDEQANGAEAPRGFSAAH